MNTEEMRMEILLSLSLKVTTFRVRGFRNICRWVLSLLFFSFYPNVWLDILLWLEFIHLIQNLFVKVFKLMFNSTLKSEPNAILFFIHFMEFEFKLNQRLLIDQIIKNIDIKQNSFLFFKVNLMRKLINYLQNSE